MHRILTDRQIIGDHQSMILNDLTGLKIGRLTVIGRAPNKGKATQWACVCSCGKKCNKGAAGLAKGTKSCGCLSVEKAKQRTTHGKSKSAIYAIWNAMKDRCRNPQNAGYKHYGKRGIRVCEQWEKFDQFYADMGDRPEGMSLDRKNNDIGYSKQNCVWATSMEQGKNRRSVRKISANGKSLCIAEWARETGISQGAIHSRVKSGWSYERAVVTPRVY